MSIFEAICMPKRKAEDVFHSVNNAAVAQNILCNSLGLGLVAQRQKKTVAAMQILDMNVWAYQS